MGAVPAPGHRIGPYTIDAPIGAGGVASVYRAHDASGRTVALKILHPSRVVDEDIKRFTREFRALSRMDHPNVVRVYEAGVANGYPWIAIEYVDGEDLDGVIARWQRDRPPDRFVQVERILRGLCRGLAYIHGAGLIHRDMKPSNILVSRDGEAKITDFGVVKDPNAGHTNLTMAGRLVGTVAFMAPEQITGEVVDARADLYALGAVLYVMLAFRRPIEASSVAGYLARHLTEVPHPPSEYEPTVPQRLERICQRLLVKEPGQRYATAAAVLEALDRVDDGALLPLRGRQTAVDEWARLLGGLHGGGGGVVAIVAAEGSGRTHLLHHLAETARQRGYAVAVASGRQDPLGALMVGAEITVPGVTDDVANRLVRGLRGSTRVLLVDDLDWADATVIASVARVVRQLIANEGAPILFAFTAISDEGPAAGLVDGGATGIPAEVIRLEALDRKAIIAILRDRGLQGPALTVLGKRLHDEHRGLPGAILGQVDAMTAEGWLERVGDLLRSTRPLEQLRDDVLPVPAGVRAQIYGRLSVLGSDVRPLIEALAVFDRATSPAVLAAAAGADEEGAAFVARGLVRDGLLAEGVEDDQEVVRFAHPATGGIVRDALSNERRRGLHLAIARALSRRRRREASIEVARHLRDGGDALGAYPAFVQAARAAARAGRINEVLEIVREARVVAAEVEPRLDPLDIAKHRRWLFLLEGEARLARSEWAEAVEPLERAVAAARVDTDRAAVGRALGDLGRAWYRQGRFDLARPVLDEAMLDLDPGAPERASATRALADILLRSGDISGSERLWGEALVLAEQIASKDGEARARRGLAHVRVIQGRLDEAARMLDVAEELLGTHGDDRVRAGVYARSIELDLAAGRFGSALRRGESLLDLLQNREIPERLPEAWALVAEARLAIGDSNGATDAVRHSVVFAKSTPDGEARIRAARVLCALGQPREALAVLPSSEDLPGGVVDDPPAQVAAARACIIAGDTPDVARDLAMWVAVRPPPLLPLLAARIQLDASHALSRVGETEAARGCAKRGLKAIQGASAEAISLELLLALDLAQPDDRVRAAADQLAARIAAGLPTGMSASFLRRAAGRRRT